MQFQMPTVQFFTPMGLTLLLLPRYTSTKKNEELIPYFARSEIKGMIYKYGHTCLVLFKGDFWELAFPSSWAFSQLYPFVCLYYICRHLNNFFCEVY